MERSKLFGRAGVRTAHSRVPSLFVEMALAFVAVLALGYVVIDQGLVSVPGLDPLPTVQTSVTTRTFSLCGNQGGGTCVIDGDTIRIDGQSIRIADIDTPEVRGYQCAQELARGQRATQRMLELVNGGFTMEMWDHRDEDRYGRKLRVLKRDGQSLGMMLVSEGLARPWGGARQSWCEQ